MTTWNALVLNADGRPVSRFPLSVWSFQRTMRNVLRERVTVLETYDVELRSQSHAYRPPSVVMLRRYVRKPARVPLTRMNVFLRDQFRCQYCGEEFASSELTFDHVVPRMAGGRNSWDNIVSACVPCNAAKGHRRDIKPRRPARQPSQDELLKLRQMKGEEFHKTWLDHLYWSGVLQE